MVIKSTYLLTKKLKTKKIQHYSENYLGSYSPPPPPQPPCSGGPVSRAGVITANKFGEKKKKLKNFACINFRESVNIEFFDVLNF